MQMIGTLVVATLVLATGSSCAQSESLDLSDQIVNAAIKLKQGGPAEVDVNYLLTLDSPSLIAVVPASGVDRAGLPEEATEEQVAGLLASEDSWRGRAFLAITWLGGHSSGVSIERHVAVQRQIAVTKPPRSTVTVRLVRDSAGVVHISGLK